MMRSTLLVLGLALAASACAAPVPTPGATSPSGSPQPASTPAPPTLTGATIGPEGFATILDAPPAPFTPALPGAAPAPDPEAAARFRRVGEFQRAVRAEAEALDRRLRTAERGNYVSRYFDNEGEPQAVFQFLRDGPGTLARYTRDPRFRGETVLYPEEELRRVADWLGRTFAADRVIQGIGTGNRANRVQVDLLVTEEEFRALVARKGVTLPHSVELRTSAERPAREINRPLPSALARLVRIFPRADRPVGVVNAINSRAKIVLRDGCFRAADHGDALVLLPLGAQLFVDGEGYLAWGEQEAPGYARIGETVIFMGSVGDVTAPELVAPIHRACGPGRVIQVNALASEAADRAQYAVTENERMLRTLQESYGLSAATAARVLERCKTRGNGICHQVPPPPVPGSACPAGTRFRGGLCRTPEGYIRPLPSWIEELAREPGGR
jgi:hypothetical protein